MPLPGNCTTVVEAAVCESIPAKVSPESIDGSLYGCIDLTTWRMFKGFKVHILGSQELKMCSCDVNLK